MLSNNLVNGKFNLPVVGMVEECCLSYVVIDFCIMAALLALVLMLVTELKRDGEKNAHDVVEVLMKHIRAGAEFMAKRDNEAIA